MKNACRPSRSRSRTKFHQRGSWSGLDEVRVHRLPARGQLAERREVEVAEQRHAQRARDGRGRHHQVVRGDVAGAQGSPLADAELVLLVDDHQAPGP